MTKIFDTLKSFYGLTANLGVVIPGFTFFINFAPPMFKGIAIIVSALSIAVIIVLSNKDRGEKNFSEQLKPYTSKAIKFLSVSFVLILVYFFLMDFTTIVPVDFPSERWQTGFDLESWSLTPLANQLMTDNSCNQDKQTLLTCASVQKESVALLWTHVSIYTAGLLLIFIFTVAALCWSAGWTFLAVAHPIKNKTKP